MRDLAAAPLEVSYTPSSRLALSTYSAIDRELVFALLKSVRLGVIVPCSLALLRLWGHRGRAATP